MKKILFHFAMFALLVCAVAPQQASAVDARFYAVGASSQFNTFAIAAVNGSGLCGKYYWTKKSVAYVHDSRSGIINDEPGNIWIVWNGSPDGTAATMVCYFLSVDSVVGQRAYFSRSTLNLPASQIGVADGGVVPYLATLGTPEALPAAIQAIVNGTTFNYAATDIRPEDAKFANIRALTPYGAWMNGRGFTGVGYQDVNYPSRTWRGTPILSSVSSASSSTATPIDYEFAANDPIVGTAARPYSELKVGAAPVMVVVNTHNTAAGHMGDAALAIGNINDMMLNKALLGQVGHVRDLSTVVNAGTAADAALHVWVREPLSGTYNTMEFNVPNTNSIAGDYAQSAGRVTGQEAGINTANSACAGSQTATGCPAESGNPLFHFIVPAIGTANGSTRGRVIGSGQMISTTNSVDDSLGYSFWGFSSFATSSAGNLKYLTVDGADPLYSSSNPNPSGTGVLPLCSAYPCVLSMDNVKNGGYPIWAMYRGVYDYTDGLNLSPAMVATAQTIAANTLSDFVPATQMAVFRSHFSQVATTAGLGYSGNNGVKSGVPETGGDMGGQVLTVSSEMDYIADTGGDQQINLKR